MRNVPTWNSALMARSGFPTLCFSVYSSAMRNVIERSGRVFVALRRLSSRVQTEPVYHAVTPNCRMALCTAEPGVKSGWAEPPAARVTCPECIRRLGRLGDA
jgi:hypothetical protein